MSKRKLFSQSEVSTPTGCQHKDGVGTDSEGRPYCCLCGEILDLVTPLSDDIVFSGRSEVSYDNRTYSEYASDLRIRGLAEQMMPFCDISTSPVLIEQISQLMRKMSSIQGHFVMEVAVAASVFIVARSQVAVDLKSYCESVRLPYRSISRAIIKLGGLPSCHANEIILSLSEKLGNNGWKIPVHVPRWVSKLNSLLLSDNIISSSNILIGNLAVLLFFLLPYQHSRTLKDAAAVCGVSARISLLYQRYTIVTKWLNDKIAIKLDTNNKCIVIESYMLQFELTKDIVVAQECLGSNHLVERVTRSRKTSTTEEPPAISQSLLL